MSVCIETTLTNTIKPDQVTTTPLPEWSPPTIAGGIEETFLLFGQPENTSGRGIGTLDNGRRIDWTAYREAIRDLYGQLHTGAVTPEAFSSELHAIDGRFGLDPVEPVPDGDVEDAPPSILGGGIAAAGLDALRFLAAPSPALPRTAASILITAAFILSACSPPTPPSGQPPVTEYPGITQQAEPNTSTPPPTAPPTPEATATTPPQEFLCWEPGEPNEVNHLVWNDTIGEQMAALVETEETCFSDWGITAESVLPAAPATGRVEYSYDLDYAPYAYLIMGLTQGYDANGQIKPRFVVTSLSTVHMPSGSENPVVGVAIRRKGSDELGTFHFMVDKAAMEYVATIPHVNYGPDLSSIETTLAFLNSDRLQSGFTVAPFIAGPGDAVLSDQIEPWSDSIFLMQTQFIDGKGFVLDTGEAIGAGLNAWALAPFLAPTHMLNSSQFDKAYRDWAETKIFPTLTFAPEVKAP